MTRKVLLTGGVAAGIIVAGAVGLAQDSIGVSEALALPEADTTEDTQPADDTASDDTAATGSLPAPVNTSTTALPVRVVTPIRQPGLITSLASEGNGKFRTSDSCSRCR